MVEKGSQATPVGAGAEDVVDFQDSYPVYVGGKKGQDLRIIGRAIKFDSEVGILGVL